MIVDLTFLPGLAVTPPPSPSPWATERGEGQGGGVRLFRRFDVHHNPI